MSSKRIIILGGGFAGVKCAKTLSKLMSGEDFELVIFNKENHMVFSPLLAEVASAAIKTKDVAAPLRQLLTGVKCRTEEILNIDLEKKFVEYEAYDMTRQKMSYDHVVVALGNTSNFSIVPGMDEHAFGLKSVGDALHLQSHVIDQLEKAEVCEEIGCKRNFLTFTVIGGGFSGVEVAGELNEFVKESSRYFETIDKSMITVNLVHSHPQILPEVTPSLREFARKKMEEQGVNFYLGRRASKVTQEGVWMDDSTLLTGNTVVCTIGTTPLQVVKNLPIEKHYGRLVTEDDMSLEGFENAWAVGDCAAIPNKKTNEISPPVGQFAERQGFQCAWNIYRTIRGVKTEPFAHEMLGQLCAIGGMNAVAEIGNVRISGFLAWFLWRAIYLMKLPSLSQKIKVGIEWACDVIFPRSIGYVKTDRSNSASKALYVPGNFVFKQGAPATNFYVIEQGEVEVLVKNQETGVDELVAVLGAGDFFGESALLENRPRNASVRARDHVTLVVIGRRLFSEISHNLAPLNEAIAKAVRRRRNIWHELPEVQKIVEKMTLAEVTEPVPGGIFRPNDLIDGLLEKFHNNAMDFCCVVDNKESLIGVITKSDLFRTIDLGAALRGSNDDLLRVHHIMGHEPVVITKDDSLKVAFTTMRERGLKVLPVVDNSVDQRLLGCIRIEKVLGRIIKSMAKKNAIRITEVDMPNPLAK